MYVCLYCTYICVSVYVLVCICMWSFKLSTYIRTYPMCLSVCLCAMQPSPYTVLVCPATQDLPDHVLSVCLCVCRPTASSPGRCTREFTACRRLLPQLWTSRTMSRGSEPWRAGWGVEWCGVRVRCGVVWCEGEMWTGVVWGWDVEWCGVRVRCWVQRGWRAGVQGDMWDVKCWCHVEILYFGKMSPITLWIFPLWWLENAVCIPNTLLAPR